MTKPALKTSVINKIAIILVAIPIICVVLQLLLVLGIYSCAGPEFECSSSDLEFKDAANQILFWVIRLSLLLLIATLVLKYSMTRK